MEDTVGADTASGRGSPATSGEKGPKVEAVAARYLNRELSMLDYQARVLARAEDQLLPLLERMRFLGHFATGLDDFYQIRVAGLKEQQEAAPSHASPDGRTPGEQLSEIRQRVDGLVQRQTHAFHEELLPGLAEAGVRVVSVNELGKKDQQQVERYYEQNVFPVLTPLAVDPGHPFPYMSHFSLNLGVVIRDPLLRLERFARLKVPPLLPRYVSLPGDRYVAIEDVIARHLGSLFEGMEIVSHGLFRVTRDNDLEVRESEADDLLLAIQSELRRHRRRASAVRLEVNPDVPADVMALLVRELELRDEDVHTVEGALDLATAANFLADLDKPQLKLRTQAAGAPSPLAVYEDRPSELFAALQKGDILVHHPYETFASSVSAFVANAAADPNVLAIKQTLYRTSGPASPIALALARAAQAGKQVVALVELKARGDEQANIAWAQALEDAGVHVVYGLVGLKTHAKVILVVRQEAEGIRRYVHVATGNYNPNTARAYEDVGLLSADEELGADASQLFNFLTGYSRQRAYDRLLVAPMNLRSNLLRLIRQEAGEPDGRIVMKMNSLEDTEIADALYEASQAGAEIDLIVRGMCVLRPGVPGLSERIRVRSIVGHFLEHSRILRFGSDRRGPRYYIGSADMMERNLDRRVEAVAPILDPALQARLAEILAMGLEDDSLSWTLEPDGSWHKVETKKHVNAQEQLAALAQERARLLESEALLA
ncbi:polyphosphate kinase 1 [Candidatus Nephthysia bennettiae]